MIDFAIHNQQTRLQIDEERLGQALCRVLTEEACTTATISLAIVDAATIRTINQKFLNHDDATDVLSFALQEDSDPLDGEIVVSADAACEVAAQCDWDPHDELMLYVIHGALHLVGYDDTRPDTARSMVQRQSYYLDQLGVSRVNADVAVTPSGGGHSQGG